MAAVVGILLALFVLPSPWGLVAILVGVSIEVAEALFWIRYTRRPPAVTGSEALVGQNAVVVEACRPDGRVRVLGELWRAHCPRGAGVGEHVRVVSVNDDLTLEVA
jgi:membrane protein implicated in regulation of membrane protease activity